MVESEGSEFHGETDGCAVATFKKFIIVVWKQQATVEAVERLDEISRLMADRHTTGFSAIHHVVRGAALPEAPARKALSQSVRAFQDTLRSAAIIVEGGGFWGSALRSFVTGLSMFSKVQADIRVFSERRPAIEWSVEVQQESPMIAKRLLDTLEGIVPVAEDQPRLS